MKYYFMEKIRNSKMYENLIMYKYKVNIMYDGV